MKGLRKGPAGFLFCGLLKILHESVMVNIFKLENFNSE